VIRCTVAKILNRLFNIFDSRSSGRHSSLSKHLQAVLYMQDWMQRWLSDQQNCSDSAPSTHAPFHGGFVLHLTHHGFRLCSPLGTWPPTPCNLPSPSFKTLNQSLMLRWTGLPKVVDEFSRFFIGLALQWGRSDVCRLHSAVSKYRCSQAYTSGRFSLCLALVSYGGAMIYRLHGRFHRSFVKPWFHAKIKLF